MVSKRNLLTWKNNSKKVTAQTKLEGYVVELSADRALFGRMIIASKSRTDINPAEVPCQHTSLSVVPRSLFSLDGTMHRISNKAGLMEIVSDTNYNATLEKLV